jgi:hypothetical protein
MHRSMCTTREVWICKVSGITEPYCCANGVPGGIHTLANGSVWYCINVKPIVAICLVWGCAVHSVTMTLWSLPAVVLLLLPLFSASQGVAEVRDFSGKHAAASTDLLVHCPREWCRPRLAASAAFKLFLASPVLSSSMPTRLDGVHPRTRQH